MGKEARPTNLSVLIVGHRRPWNRHIRLTQKQWKLGVGIIAGVIPLLMAVGVYSMLGCIFTTESQSANRLREIRALRTEVALLTQNTATGLNAMGLQLGALNADAMRLTALRDRLVRSAGIHVALFRKDPHLQARTQKVTKSPHLMVALHTLSEQLQQQASPKNHPRRAL